MYVFYIIQCAALDDEKITSEVLLELEMEGLYPLKKVCDKIH